MTIQLILTTKCNTYSSVSKNIKRLRILLLFNGLSRIHFYYKVFVRLICLK